MGDLVHIHVTSSGPLFSLEQGDEGDNTVTVNGTTYSFDHSSGGVDLYQNFNFADTVSLVNMRVMGNHIIVKGGESLNQVISLWKKWSDKIDLPEVEVSDPLGLHFPNVVKRARKAKTEEEEKENVEPKDPVESSCEEDEDEDDDDDYEDDDDEKVEDVMPE